MKKNGCRDARIAGPVHTLKALIEHSNLQAAESAKTDLAKDEFSINPKQRICEDLLILQVQEHSLAETSVPLCVRL